MSARLLFALALVVVPLTSPCRGAEADLQTVAEATGYKATSRNEQVLDFCERLAKDSPVVRLSSFGTSGKGNKLPLLVLGDPALTTPEEAAKSNKLVVLVTANIHGGEVDGKEAILALARDLARAKERPLFKDVVLLVVPNLNPDGNDRLATTNRPEQNGPAEVGERANAQGLDLNRDFVKLESPEIRALTRLLDRWNPAVVIDMHTTNGSYHRYAITYDGPRHPAAPAALVRLTHDKLLPAVGKTMEEKDGLRSYYYGDFSADRKAWQSYPPLPRFGLQTVALRGRIGLLCESYSLAPYKDRVQASRVFVQRCLEYLAANAGPVREALKEAAKPADEVALRFKLPPSKEPVTILGFEEEVKDGRRVSTGKPREYKVDLVWKPEVTLAQARPAAYLFPAKYLDAVHALQRHGLDVEELREDIELPVEVLRVDASSKAERAFQKHNGHTVSVTGRKESRLIPAGTVVVRTSQPLGTLAGYLLEPMADDGLTWWNFFDEGIKQSDDHPVLRLPTAVALTTGKVRKLPEDRKSGQPLTLKDYYDGKLPNLAGSPVGGLTWLDDGEHFLQFKERRHYKVHAATGRPTLFIDPAVLEKSLADIPGLPRRRATVLANAPRFHMNPQRTGALIEHDNDYYFLPFDGKKVVRLTRSPGAKEEPEFSPDGKYLAYVKGNNLHVVDLATQTEKALTSDGSDVIFNGKNTWVYFEEIFNRQWKGFWWSPDSSQIAFLRYDDRPVNRFTVLDHLPVRQNSEITAYPKSGDPNPLVKLGVVAVTGSKGPRFADRGDYSENAMLFSRVGWTGDGKVFCQVQDRAQTWLDLCVMEEDGTLKRLFRDTTKAWIDDQGGPKFLKDGTFLWPSERSGFKHYYHYAADGKLRAAVTSGEWEARDLHRIDEAGGWVYFSGTKDGSIGLNLYRVKLDGSKLTRLTPTGGNHVALVSPKANYFVQTSSSRTEPVRVRLCNSDGSPVRTIDSNPVHTREEYATSAPEYFQIKSPDGFPLEASVIKPVPFDPARKYPVWFKTYGGPHAPTVVDAWWGARLDDQVLAHMGFVVFRMDPRSASGKGASATWTAYRRLGVQELKDVETAIGWLTAHSWVDARRVGMSGHSYGGFLTAYAMTHSKLFAAGIAGAPVTDWRNYDSIYTERYMNTPQENPKGYDETSVVKAAAKLHGKLLIVHGIMDDNVHVQNAVQLVDALQKANKDFELMMYPRARHPIHGPHYQRTLMEFMRRELKPERTPEPAEKATN